MEEELMEGTNNREIDVAPTLLAVHPLEHSVVVAAGSELRVYSLRLECSISLTEDDNGGSCHKDSIRSICFGASGRLFASGGDDKLVKVWGTDSWRCLQTISSEKRVSALAISHDGNFLTFADKFGVVWVASLKEEGENGASKNIKASPILAHYCSTITSLKFSPDGRFIASADKDYKIRITLFPRRPLDGAHDIQSFCLGHTDFISCISFVCNLDCPIGYLVSGGGDSTVRLWDFISGHLLDTCKVGSKDGVTDIKGYGDASYSAITNICTSSDGLLVFASVQSLQGVAILRCNLSTRSLSVAKVITMGNNFIPTSLSICFQHLWMVSGASNSDTLGSPLVWLRVLTGFSEAKETEPYVLEDDEIPGGQKLLEKLQGYPNVSREQKALAAAAEAVKTSMCNLLTKKQYSEEKRELRKKTRNDKKQQR